ncbi:hypothetical protein [uncultured Tessaracoccus sp.]|uniref:hypothetical protein n=1 Tax=uncultured Tessaracoccus sp. TaxID=905023 RepID=UPI0025E58299|nr:hypothetical protein [uncultured Tessaracoccus sp.]
MGLFRRLFSRAGADEEVAPIDVEAKRAQLDELSSALTALTRRMRDAEFPQENPGWQGRIGDLVRARTEADALGAAPEFDRQDLYDYGLTVRPLYRGEPPEEYRALAAENARVVQALDALLD